ncbi:hypothetical protein [Streptomyces gobitricini]|uniref:Secreted protein n=1 Tax=Streptomyces gobitricini TaxID=68211 RepID=A0ABN3N692_9ACTN
MTAAAVVPVTVPRLVRGAVARRAPAVVLFLGGLLALGFLLGGQAHAADRPPAAPVVRLDEVVHVDDLDHEKPRVAAERLPAARDAGPTATGSRPTVAVREAEEAAVPVARTVTGPAKGTVREVVTGPAKGTVREVVTGPAADTVREVVGGLPETAGGLPETAGGLPETAGALPETAGGLPGVTGALPEVPSAPPVLPALPIAPAAPLPVPLPGLGAPLAPPTGAPGGPGAAQDGATVPEAAGRDVAAPQGATAARDLAAQPRTRATALQPAAPDTMGARTAPYRAADTRIAPPSPPSAPGPCGGAVRQSATGDGGTPRPGDQHAVASPADAHRAPARNTVRPATAAPIQDRPHTILEFPG